MSLRCLGGPLLQTLPSPLLLGASTASVSIWFRVNPGSSVRDPAGVRLFGDESGAISVGLNASGALRVAWSAADGSAATGSTWEQAILPGVAYHLAATWQDGAQRYYLNGILADSGSRRGALGPPGPATPRRFLLGPGAAGVDVALDEVALWDGHALTAGEVLAIRDRTAPAGSIAPESNAFRWSLSGPEGQAARIGDAGLSDASKPGLGLANLSGPAPTYQASLAFDRRPVDVDMAVCPSGEMILFLARDAATIPASVVSLSDQDEIQQLSIRQAPAGGTFRLSIDGQETGPIAFAERLPACYFQWNFALPGPGDYDLAVYVNTVNDHNFKAPAFEILDSGARVGLATFDMTNPQAVRGNAFFDETVQGGAAAPAAWTPLGRFTFATKNGAVRLSGNRPAPGQEASSFFCDSIRVAGADGGMHFRVGPDAPPASFAGGFGFSQNIYTGIYGSERGGYEATGLGAGTRSSLDPAAIRAALESLPNIGAGNVAVTGDGLDDSPLRVAFVGGLSRRSISLMAPSDPALVASRYSVGANWPKISINGGPPIALADPYWGAGHGDPNNPSARTHSPYLPFVAFPFYQAGPASVDLRLSEGRSSLRGSWDLSRSTGGYGFEVYQTGAVGSSASWTAEGLTAGDYRVSLTWSTDAAAAAGLPAASAATCRVTNRAGAVLGSYQVNQSVPPGGVSDRGVRWEALGTLTSNEPIDDLTVTLANDAGGLLVADAARVERLTPDASIRIKSGDVVTCTSGDGWAITTAGPVPGVASAPVANRIGGTLFPPIDDAPKAMHLGWNVATDDPNGGSRIYANLASACFFQDGITLDEDGNPSRFTYYDSSAATGNLVLEMVGPPPVIGGPGRGGYSFPPGRYTILWDGTSDLGLNISAGSEVVSERRLGATGGRRAYDVEPAPGCYTPFVKLQFNSSTRNPDGTFSLDARNIRVYPPGIDPDNPPKYLPGFIDKIRPARSLRFLDPLKAIFGNVYDFEDYQPSRPRLSRVRPRQFVTVPVVEVRAHDPAADPVYDTEGYVPVRVTTGVPHGLHDGFHVRIDREIGPLRFSTGQTAGSIVGYDVPVRVLSPTEFVFATSFGLDRDPTNPNKLAGHPVALTNVVGDVGGLISYELGNGMPLEDIVEICNLANNGEGADIYVNTYVACSDDCLRKMGAYIARNLKPGRKIRVECSNEIWNFVTPPFTYLNQQTLALGLGRGGWQPAYCELAAHHWSLFRESIEAAGRGGDLIRVLGSQYGASGTTDALVAYCRARGFEFEELALAPYAGNAASPTTGLGIYESQPGHVLFSDRLTAEQDLDMLEAFHTWGGYEIMTEIHRDALDAHGYTGVKLVNYEGGGDELLLRPADRAPIAMSRRTHQVHRHPRYYHWVLNFFRRQQDGGVTTFHYFLLAAGGDFVEFAHIPTWISYNNTVSQLPGTGDPAVDLANLLTPERPDLVKSEIGGAFNRWASLVSSAAPAPAPPPSRRPLGRNGMIRATGLPRGMYRTTSNAR